MRRAACRFASRGAWSATASTSAVGSSRSWTWKSPGEASRTSRHPSSLPNASDNARDARRLGAALAGLGAFALAGVDASRADASASSPVQSSGASAVPSGSPQPSFGEGSRPDAVSLAALAADVSSGPDIARRRALRLLTQITLFIDHHDAVLAVPEVLRALLAVLARSESDERRGSLSSTYLATRCLADLAKAPRARAALVADARALRALKRGLSPDTHEQNARAPGEASDAPDDTDDTSGVVAAARAAAESARLAAALAGDAACHAPMRAAGVIDALARADAAFEASARWPHRAWRRWRRAFSFPTRRKLEAKARKRGVDDASESNENDSETEARVLTERARHAAAAWFGFAGTSEGTAAIAEADATGLGVTRRVRAVAVAETDAVAFRYAAGCLARLVAGDFFDAKPFAEKRETLRALASALRSGDGQAACFAAAAARAALAEGSARTNAALLRRGFVDGALFLLTSPEEGWCVESPSKSAEHLKSAGGARCSGTTAPLDATRSYTKRNASKRRNDGARLCALRLLHAFASSGDEATRRAVAVNGATILGEFAAGEARGAGAGAEIRNKASAVLAELGL